MSSDYTHYTTQEMAEAHQAVSMSDLSKATVRPFPRLRETKTADLRWSYRSPIAFGIPGHQVLQQRVIIDANGNTTEEWRDV